MSIKENCPISSFWPSILAFSITLLCSIAFLAQYTLNIRSTKNSVVLFLRLITTCFTLRVIWLILRASKSNDSFEDVLNSSILLIQFTAFCFYLSMWAEAIQVSSRNRWTSPPIMVWGLILLVIFSQVILLFLSLRSQESQAYDNSMLLHGACFLLLSIGFVYYGLGLRKSIISFEVTPKVTKQLRKIQATAAICSFCFGLRAVFLTYRPISIKLGISPCISSLLYPHLIYDIPEITPGLTMLFLLKMRMKEEEEEEPLIQ